MTYRGPHAESVKVHPTAIVAEGAVLGEGTEVGPYSIIGPRVVLGARNKIASHVVIEGNTTIGQENHFFQFCSVGSAPQDLKYKGENSRLIIGDRNLVREFVTLQPGTEGGGMLTSIGSGNLFMANSHVGHDGMIGDRNVFANSAAIAGHVTVGSFVVVGGLVGVHQFVRLGDSCLLGGGAMVTQDIPPFCICQGDRARLCGVNVVSLERRGVGEEEIREIKGLYRKLFVAGGILKEKIESLKKEVTSPHAKAMIEFVGAAERGVAGAGKELSE
jgi:UDP-N-acetylglucosamine acyltransferase